MPYYTASAAIQARQADNIFTIRVEYVGTTAKGNPSSKFWSIEGFGDHSVDVSWGKIGGKARSQRKSWTEAYNKLYEKLHKGYRYASGTVDEFTVPKPVAPKLTGPFSLIQVLRSLGHRQGWEALDSSGSVLFELPPASGCELRDVYNIRVAS